MTIAMANQPASAPPAGRELSNEEYDEKYPVLKSLRATGDNKTVISLFAADLQSSKTFSKAWSEAGGVPGLVATMATMSVNDVHRLCKALGYRPQPSKEHNKRREAMTKLVAALCPDKNASSSVDIDSSCVNKDSRPLRKAYSLIVPACDLETSLQWEKAPEDLGYPLERLRRLRSKVPVSQSVKQRTLDEFFSASHAIDGLASDLSLFHPLIQGDLEFGLKILERFAESDSLLAVTTKSFFDDLAHLLARRCERAFWKRHDALAWEQCYRFWQIFIRCLQKHSKLTEGLRLNTKDVYGRRVKKGTLSLAVKNRRLNSRSHACENEEIITALFSLMPQKIAKLENTLELTRIVPIPTRYRLLRLFYLHARGVDIGPVDNVNYSVLSSERFYLSIHDLCQLPDHEALALLEQHINAHPNLVFLTDHPGSSISNRPLGPGIDHVDPTFLRAMLLRRTRRDKLVLPVNPDAILARLKTEELTKRKKSAERGHNSEIRTFWSISALCLTICIGDVNLYAETLLWARRFNKDPLTVMRIYGSNGLIPPVSFLSIIGDVRDRKPSQMGYASIGDELQTSHKVVRILVETAILALQEPGFNLRNWSNVLSLMLDVAQERMRSINHFQDRFRISDEEVFEKIWEPTIATLIQVEGLMLQPGNERLEWQNRFKHHRPGCESKLRPPTMRFLDNLAKARNDLWIRHRSQIKPSVITLPPPWPRGLPVQNLLPFSIPVDSNWTEVPLYLPYIESRVKAILFGDATTYLSPPPREKELQDAIGDFVDDWSQALQLYLRGTSSLERKDRVLRVWEHATGDFSRGRMSHQEAERFWTPHFSQHPGFPFGDFRPQGQQTVVKATAQMPPPESNSEPVEWNPDSIFGAQPEPEITPSPATPRQLSQTCLDILLKTYGDPFQRVCEVPVAPINVQRRPNFWFDAVATDESSIDAHIAAAVLYINSRCGADTSLLMRPFPSEANPRFPAMFLDQEFLERQDYYISGAQSMLTRYVDKLPVELLNQLGYSLLLRLKGETAHARQQHHVLDLIKMLLGSCNPSVGFPLLIQFIVELPQDSAWHRQLFHTGRLNSLRPQDAQTLVQNLSKALLEQYQRKEPTTNSSTEGLMPDAAPVKVTTFKMIAQTLRESPAINPLFAANILVNILHQTRHIDIHLEILRALDQTVNETSGSQDQEHIMDTIRQGVMLRASSLNERSPETEEDWEIAEQGGPLPEVWDISNGDPRILNWIIYKSANSDSRSREIGRRYAEILRQAQLASAQANQRWALLFLKKYGFTFPKQELPRVPPFPKALVKKYISDMPPDVFDTMRQHVLRNLEPGLELSAITKSVKANADIVNSNAGKHWLSLWDQPGLESLSLGVEWAGSRLFTLSRQVNDNPQMHVSIDKLEAFLLEIVDILLSQGNLVLFERVIQILSGDKGTIMQRIINRVDALRTPEWQSNRNRQPSVLPDTFPLTLLQIQPVKDQASGVQSTCTNVSDVTASIVTLIDEIASHGLPYHKRFQDLKGTLASSNLTIYEHPEVAVLLGSPPAVVNGCVPTLSDYLRVEVSVFLLQLHEHKYGTIEIWEAQGAEEAQDMVRTWADSSVEDYRNAAQLFPTAFRLKA